MKTTGALSYNGTTAINLGGNITTSGATIGLTGPITLIADSIADTTNAGGTPAGANITLSSTCNGAKNLTLTGGTAGVISFGAIGGTTSLNAFTTSGATITQTSTAKKTVALSYTGSTVINLGGNITTSGGTIGLTGPVTLTANAVLDATNAGGTAAGANIISQPVSTEQSLTLTGGTGGIISFGVIEE